MDPGLEAREADEVEGGRNERALRQRDGFQVLGGDSEDVVDFFEMISIIKEATIGRLVVVFML